MALVVVLVVVEVVVVVVAVVVVVRVLNSSGRGSFHSNNSSSGRGGCKGHVFRHSGTGFLLSRISGVSSVERMLKHTAFPRRRQDDAVSRAAQYFVWTVT